MEPTAAVQGPFFTPIIFWVAVGMSAFCLLLFAYIAIEDAKSKRGETARAARNLESMNQVGDLAEKFSKSGHASSAMACSVMFALLGTAVALALDKLSVLPFGGP